MVPMENLQNSQSHFENLIREVIPSSISIIQKGKLIFVNKKSQEIFKIEHQESLLEIFENMQVNAYNI